MQSHPLSWPWLNSQLRWRNCLHCWHIARRLRLKTSQTLENRCQSLLIEPELKHWRHSRELLNSRLHWIACPPPSQNDLELLNFLQSLWLRCWQKMHCFQEQLSRKNWQRRNSQAPSSSHQMQQRHCRGMWRCCQLPCNLRLLMLQESSRLQMSESACHRHWHKPLDCQSQQHWGR